LEDPLHHLRRIGLVILLTGVLLATTLYPPTTAAATNCGGTCEGKDPVTYGCVSGATTLDSLNIVSSSTLQSIGTAHLRYSSYCHATFAETRWDVSRGRTAPVLGAALTKYQNGTTTKFYAVGKYNPAVVRSSMSTLSNIYLNACGHVDAGTGGQSEACEYGIGLTD
jgi:hypothetical protein